MGEEAVKRIINEKGVFDIRPAERSDLEYILSTWKLTWEQSPEMDLPGMIRDKYFEQAGKLLEEIVPRASRNGSLYICQMQGAPHIIRGFLCGEVTTEPDIAYLHWVGIKRKEWGKGVGSALMEAFIKDFDIRPEQNILYTFSSKAMQKCPGLAKKVTQRYSLVAFPWMKYEGWTP